MNRFLYPENITSTTSRNSTGTKIVGKPGGGMFFAFCVGYTPNGNY